MSTPVMHEITQEAAAEVNPTFAVLDSPQDEVASIEPEVKTEQIETSDVVQTQEIQYDENAQLRQMLREQKIELELLKGTVLRHEQVQNSDVGADVPLSDIEQLQADIAELDEVRSGEIAQLLEVMELNPKYEDVKVVCTRANFDDILGIAAGVIAEEHGMSEAMATLMLEREVWSQPNPYKYMYDLIKEYHTAYAGKQELPAAQVARSRTAVEAPVSISGIAGGDSGIPGGWTASKIDALPETELSKVPVDIYEKYLRGNLA